jgi:hypothetical protein
MALTLQFDSAFTYKLCQVFEIITSRDTKAANEILGCTLKIAVSVVTSSEIIFRTTKVGVARDGGCPVKLAESLFSFLLRIRVEAIPSEELVRRDTLLATESGSSALKFLV